MSERFTQFLKRSTVEQSGEQTESLKTESRKRSQSTKEKVKTKTPKDKFLSELKEEPEVKAPLQKKTVNPENFYKRYFTFEIVPGLYRPIPTTLRDILKAFYDLDESNTIIKTFLLSMHVDKEEREQLFHNDRKEFVKSILHIVNSVIRPIKDLKEKTENSKPFQNALCGFAAFLCALKQIADEESIEMLTNIQENKEKVETNDPKPQIDIPEEFVTDLGNQIGGTITKKDIHDTATGILRGEGIKSRETVKTLFEKESPNKNMLSPNDSPIIQEKKDVNPYRHTPNPRHGVTGLGDDVVQDLQKLYGNETNNKNN